MAHVLLSPCPQSAPPPLCPSGRTPDLKALLSVVDSAQSFIYIAVMNYLPTMEFSHPRRYCWWVDGERDEGAHKAGSGAEARGQMEAKRWGEAEKTEVPGRGAWVLQTRAEGQREGWNTGVGG